VGCGFVTIHAVQQCDVGDRQNQQLGCVGDNVLGAAVKAAKAAKAVQPCVSATAAAALQAALRDGAASPQQLRQLILDIATASRNLVKNQTTWFRDDDLFRWDAEGTQQMLFFPGDSEFCKGTALISSCNV
jgi:tRNA A37 N6-isopentenylltransferase MiaA